MFICKQYDDKKEKLIKLFNESIKKAELMNAPVLEATLKEYFSEECPNRVIGVNIEHNNGNVDIIGICARDNCLYFITDANHAIKCQLNKKEWKNMRNKLFKVYMNYKVNEAFKSTSTTKAIFSHYYKQQ